MKWWQVSLTVEPELAEAAADVLGRFSLAGVAVSAGLPSAAPGPLTVQAYYPDDPDAPRTRQAIREALWHLSQIRPLPDPRFDRIEEQDWAEVWKAQYRPLPIGERLVILPTWERTDPGARIPVYLDPGMAFGTGAHPTTRLCLHAIERILRPGDRVVDLGCGSGILAVAAARLGAGRVLACDIDPEAVESAQRSARANDVGNAVEVYLGSLGETLARLEADGVQADLVVANILATVIQDMMRDGLHRALREGGKLVVSGILAEQSDSVIDVGGQNGLQWDSTEAEGDWRAVRFDKRRAPPES